MAIKEVFAPHLNRPVKLGRLPRVAGKQRLHLSDFISHAMLPPPPPSCDYWPKAASVLTDIYGNDTLGDCVVAGGYHVLGVEIGNATGVPFHATKAQIVKDYSAIGGYVPGKPSTDNGCNEETAFEYWKKHGFANGSKILGTISINASNKADIQAACYLFENLFFGVGLPDAWIEPFPSGPGFVWGVHGHANPNNGHCFIATGYGPSGVTIDSWGLKGVVTYDAVAAYAGPSAGGEIYAVITPDQLLKGQQKAPNGLAWGDLIAAFNALGGNVPVPPPPAPVYAPTATMTLGECQLCAIDLLHNAPGVRDQTFTRQGAEKLVTDSIAKHWPKV